MPTPITNPCNAEEGMSVIYFTIHKKRISKISIQLIIVSKGIRSAPNSRTKSNITPESAHAIQNTLYLLEVVSAANPHHRIPVNSQVSGSSQLASARDILRGILIVATERPAFRFSPRLPGNVMIDICWNILKIHTKKQFTCVANLSANKLCRLLTSRAI